MSGSVTLVPTAKLRWFGVKGYDVLQQWWSDPLDVSGKGEWREIPRVFDDRKPTGVQDSWVVFLGGEHELF